MGKLYSISELAKDLGTTARAIRLYETKGLLAPLRAGGARVYSRRDRARLILIQRGKRLGFSLREIARWLDLYDADPTQETQMRRLLQRVRLRIADLEAQSVALDETLDELRNIESEALSHCKTMGIAPTPLSTALEESQV